MSKTGKVFKIMELIDNITVDGVPNPSAFNIINKDDQIGVKFRDNGSYSIIIDNVGKKLPWDFSRGNLLRIEINGKWKNNFETLEGLPTTGVMNLRLSGLPHLKNLDYCPEKLNSLGIIDCRSIKSLKNIPVVDDIYLHNLLNFKTYDYEQEAQYISLSEMSIENVCDIKAKYLTISDHRCRLDFSRTPQCDYMTINDCHFSNTDGFKKYKGTVSVAYRWSQERFDFKVKDAYDKFEEFVQFNEEI